MKPDKDRIYLAEYEGKYNFHVIASSNTHALNLAERSMESTNKKFISLKVIDREPIQ